MDGRVPAAIFSVLLSGFIAIAACGRAAAASPTDSAMTITGNTHVGADAVRSYFHAGPDGRLDADRLDAALKSLYATGLFQGVKISRDGDRISGEGR